MRILLGIILGVILTVAGAYAYDSSTGRAANGLSPLASTTSVNRPPMVNWNVVSEDWSSFQASVKDSADNIEKSLKRHTG
jgi:hypothetical protein